MATQYLNTEKLEDKKMKLELHKTSIIDCLTKIKDEYLGLILNDYWWGNKSDIFFESLKSYWYDFSAPEDSSSSNRGIIGNVEADFNNMISFIQNAIDLSLGEDVEAAEEIEGISDLPPTGGNEGTAPAPQTPEEPEIIPETGGDEGDATDGYIPTVTPSDYGTPQNVSVGGFYPQECNNENTYVSGLNYKIINEDGTPASDNIAKETISVGGRDYQVYTYDDPETSEKEHYIIGALIEHGERSRPTGNVYSIDFGNGNVYEFVDLDTNYSPNKGSEKVPSAANYNTYVDILSVRGHAFTNVGIESNNPVKITNTGITVSRK